MPNQYAVLLAAHVQHAAYEQEGCWHFSNTNASSQLPLHRLKLPVLKLPGQHNKSNATEGTTQAQANDMMLQVIRDIELV